MQIIWYKNNIKTYVLLKYIVCKYLVSNPIFSFNNVYKIVLHFLKTRKKDGFLNKIFLDNIQRPIKQVPILIRYSSVLM
jgi:hypothetical protein